MCGQLSSPLIAVAPNIAEAMSFAITTGVSKAEGVSAAPKSIGDMSGVKSTEPQAENSRQAINMSDNILTRIYT